jgi:HSP20 family protein
MSDNHHASGSAHPESTTPPLDRVRQEMERWLEVARNTGERAMESLGLGTLGKGTAPAVDILEVESEVIVLVDLPGVAAEAVKLSLVGNMLTIEGTRTVTVFPELVRRHSIERLPAKFERSVPLPAAVDLDQIRAETRDGLLTVTLRKLVPTPGRTIPVAHAASSKSVETT